MNKSLKFVTSHKPVGHTGIFNRPGVAGAVLQKHLSLIKYSFNSLCQ